MNVDITSLGDANAATINYIVNGGDVQQLANLGLGITPVGPFPHGDEVSLVLQHGSNAFCEIDLGTYSDPGDCPNLIYCGEVGEILDYCYTANDSRNWVYESVGSGTLRLTFLRGTIESNTYDDLRIYDGADNTAPLLFEHTNATAYNLGPVGSAVVSAVTNFYGVEVFATGNSLYMEMTSDGSVQCDGSTTYDSWEWEVVCLDCELPVVSYQIVDDCENGQFSIPVTVTSTGDGSIVNIVYTVNGGDPQTVVDIGVGTADLGPFALNDTVNVTVEHEDNFLCNREFGDLTDTGTCPELIECGTELSDVLCYGNNADRRYYYRGTGTFPIAIFFDSGNIPAGDLINVYDGGDITDPLLYSGNNGGDATGLFVISTNPEHRLTLRITSNGFTSCADATPQVPLEWRVGCLDCNPAVAEFSVVQDCDNFQYFIDVAISDLGSDPEAGIITTATQDTLYVTETGTVQLGPFVSGTEVEVTILNDANSLCNVYSGTIVNPICPTIVECGTELNVTFCHGENENEIYLFQGNGTFPIAMIFNSGSLETCCDHLYVYDGADINAPLLTPVGGINGDLTGQLFISTNPDHYLTVRVTTDGSVSCQSGAQIELDWTVSCLDCQPPAVEFEVVQDCENFQYFIDVAISDLGTDPEPAIINTATQDTVYVTEPGTTQLGPFVSGTVVNVTVVNDANSLCNVYSGALINPLCPTIITCGTDYNDTFCHGENENEGFLYQGTGEYSIGVIFNSGSLETCCDHLYVYDGVDMNAPLLTPVGGINGDLSGQIFYSTNPDHFLFFRVTTDGSVSCQSGSQTELNWNVYCLDCSTPETTINIVPDCRSRTYMAEVIVTATGGDTTLAIINTLQGDSIMGAGVGVHTFGPYALDSLSYFQITNEGNGQCRLSSDTLTYAADSCIFVSCGSDNYDHCYGNDEDRWYTYQAEGDFPITIGFLQGQMLSGDRIVLYNGRNESANVLYQGNNGGNLAGFALNSQNAERIITLRIQSNGAGSCDDGQVLNELRWSVQCGAVGLTELAADGFAVYPNPTSDILQIELGAKVSGSVQCRVLDMSGRVVIERSLQMNGGTRNVLDMGDLQSGQYLVQLTTANWVRTERVQVAR
ncbi:MAG: T9SS type A sorting domain-containing protein [Flavobacteriales bacterium]